MTSPAKGSVSTDLGDFIDKVSTNVRIVDAFLIGSAAELPLEYLLSTPDDVVTDQLKFQRNECAVPHGSTPPHGFTGTVFRVEPISRRLGYAQLLRPGGEYLGDFGYVSSPSEIFAACRWTRKAPQRSRTLVDRYDMNEFLLSQHPFARQLMAHKGFSMHVHASVSCTHWPREASEWSRRTRTQGWPTPAVIESVAAAGCHLTPCVVDGKGENRGPTVFRYSFSVAEVMLVRTWSDVQRYVYHILLLIKKDTVRELRARGHESAIDSYHVKTLMLWACETRSAEFWDKTNIRSAIGELLCQLIECLVERSCPNYFIPSNNLFEHLTEDLDLEAEISPLLVYKEQGASRLAASVPMIDPMKTTALMFSDKILNMGYIGLGHVNLRPWNRVSASAMYGRNKLDNLPDRSEFELLYSGIKTHLGLVLSRNKLEIGVQGSSEIQNSDRIGKVIRYFEQAMCTEASTRHSIPVCLGNNLSEVIASIFKISNNSETEDGHLDLNSAQNSSDLGQAKTSDSDKESTPSCAVNDSSNSTNSQLGSSSQSCESNQEDGATSHSSFQTVLGLCMNAILPTMDKQLSKATYLISAAYRANFYHTYMKNYQMSLRLCEEALKQTRGREFTPLSVFNDQVCSLVLTRKFLPLFDEHIQVVYGFLTLSQTLRNSGSHTSTTKQSPLHYLSPSDFLRYVKHQCERRLLYCSSSGQLESTPRFSYDFTCRSPEILCAALRISDTRSRTRKLQRSSWYDAENRPHYWN